MGGEQTRPDGAARGIAVMVPARNASTTLDRCLASLVGQRRCGDEMILVDDASTDETAAIARRHGARVISLPICSGPAAARNAAAATSDAAIFFFVDADVELAGDALERVRSSFDDPDLAAVMGSYDDDPGDPSWIARYKNLAHHFVHQRGAGEARTFFAACGAIRRDVFLAAGGFDAERYPRPSIEDVELGVRLVAAGQRIRLDPAIQGKHLKGWRLGSWLRSDVCDRAAPWTRLALERRAFGTDLNLGWRDRFAAGTALVLAATLAGALVDARLVLGAGAAAGLAFLLNRDLYRLFERRGGVAFALVGFFLHQLHYGAALVGLVIGAVEHGRSPGSRATAAVAPTGAALARRSPSRSL